MAGQRKKTSGETVVTGRDVAMSAGDGGRRSCRLVVPTARYRGGSLAGQVVPAAADGRAITRRPVVPTAAGKVRV